MAEKQSLYELLGLTDKASPEDILSAHRALRQAMDVEPASEERSTGITILNDARDVLLDRQQRASYDRRQRDRRQQGRRQINVLSGGSKWHGVALALLLCASLGYPAWYYLTPPRPVAEPLRTKAAVAPEPTREAPAASEKRDIDTLAADIAARLPLVVSTVAPPAAVPAEAPARSLAESPPASSARAIAESSYAILGGDSLGTGVAIGREKLLTNCHVIAPNVHKGPLLAISAATGEQTRITHAAFLVKEDACVAYAPGLNAKPVPMRDARLTPGTTIYSLGFAQGRLTYSTGTLVGIIQRSGQNYLLSTNYCDHGVSGGPLVDADGNLVGLTSGGTRDKRFCASLTAETARRVLDQTLIAIDGFPTDYLTNLQRRW
ncbi:MAG: hypothetical protein D4R84_15565 [Rhodocyclaceae bacterium]|nr:MAG: hypothetical protein D4R84_15565 [Rhodocyclaceae bacterium]